MFNWFFKIRSYENEVHARTLNTQITVVLSSTGIRPAEDYEMVVAWVAKNRERIDSQEYGDSCDMLLDEFPRATRVVVEHGGRHFGAAVRR